MNTRAVAAEAAAETPAEGEELVELMRTVLSREASAFIASRGGEVGEFGSAGALALLNASSSSRSLLYRRESRRTRHSKSPVITLPIHARILHLRQLS